MKTIILIIAWTWIAVPLSWGVYQSVQKEVGREKKNDVDHAALEPLPSIRVLIASQVVTWVGSLR